MSSSSWKMRFPHWECVLIAARGVDMIFGTRRARHALLATCACVAVGAPATAQEANPDDPGDTVVLSPIEVTAQYRDQDALDVPISMAVIDGLEIEDRGLEDLSDALNTTPNVLLRVDNGTMGFSTITMRGVGNQGGGMAGGDQAIGMYVDGVYMGAQAGMNPQLFDLERVEVLRGPQGTLYGRNAMGGAVNVITARPDADTYGSVEAEYGSYGRYTGTGILNAHLGTWDDTTLSGRVSVQRAGRDTTVDNTVGDDMGDFTSTGVRAQTRATSSRFDVTLQTDYTEQNGGAFAYTDFDTAADRRAAIAEPMEYDVKTFGVSLNAEIPLGDLTLHSISAWRGTRSYLDGSDWLDPSPSLLQGAEWEQRQLSQEFRLTSPDAARLRWTTGLFIFHNQEDERNFYGHRPGAAALFGMFANGEREESRSSTTTNSQAVFADVTYGVTDWLDVTVGGRLTHDVKDTHYTHESAMGFAPAQTLDDEIESLDFSPRVTVTLMPADDIRIYGSISRGYKSGGFNRQFAPTTKLDFDPEHLWNYEIGAKMRLFEDRVELNGALFFTDWYDQQVTTWRGTYNDISNISRSQSYGAEVDLTARVTESLTLGGSFGWTEATFVDFPNPTADMASGDGLRQPNAPRFTYALSAQYQEALRHVVPVDLDVDVMARADYTYRSSYYYDVTNQLQEPGYGLLDLRAGVMGDGWRMEGFVTNVTDEDYRVQAVQYNGADLAIAGDPRAFGLRVKVDL
jgi:iron complex outermembrane receptor protein